MVSIDSQGLSNDRAGLPLSPEAAQPAATSLAGHRSWTLLTDFGSRGGYVAQIKGAILELNPTLQIVDIDHAIPPHDIYAGAWTLACVFRWFPPGTVHVAVVEPGRR